MSSIARRAAEVAHQPRQEHLTMTFHRHLQRRSALVAAIGLPTLAQAAASPAQPGQALAEANRQLVARAFERWAQGGNGFFRDMLAPDVIWTIKGSSPVAGTYRGVDDFLNRAVKPFADRMATPLRPTAVHHIWSEADRVAVHWDGEGTAKDGQRYRNSYVWMFRMADGRATEVVAFLDLAPFDDVIRRIPAP
jgi:uncharacterized protein